MHWNVQAGKYKWLFLNTFGEALAEDCSLEGLDIRYHLEPLIALAMQESGGNPFVKNDSSSARGIFQPLDETGIRIAEELGFNYDPYNPWQNIRIGVHLYKENLKFSKGRVCDAFFSHFYGLGSYYEVIGNKGIIEIDPYVMSVADIIKIRYREPVPEIVAAWEDYLSSHEAMSYLAKPKSKSDSTMIISASNF
jgi:hypothetical protein